ncbi:MAG TPA: hypothetical protein VMB71_13745 [Acetobacteraceae bacterium]|nr:hypothetical protein [Acetobacteraceae bacterium]
MLMQGVVAAGLLGLPHPGRAEVRGNAAPPAGATYTDQVSIPGFPGHTNWVQVEGGVSADTLVTAWVPPGETDLDWTDMVTIKTMALSRDPEQVVGSAVGVMRQICGKLNIVKTPFSSKLGDAGMIGVAAPEFTVQDMLVTCSDPNMAALRKLADAGSVTLKRYEVTWYRIMKGQANNFIVLRAWHGDVMDEGSPLGSEKTLDAWKDWLTHVTLKREPR